MEVEKKIGGGLDSFAVVISLISDGGWNIRGWDDRISSTNC